MAWAAGIQPTGPVPVWGLSMSRLCPSTDTGTQQECASTIWPKRNEMPHVRNAGNSCVEEERVTTGHVRCVAFSPCQTVSGKNTGGNVQGPSCTVLHWYAIHTCDIYTQVVSYLLSGWTQWHIPFYFPPFSINDWILWVIRHHLSGNLWRTLCLTFQ